MSTLELRPNASASVEDLVSRIAELVLERQSLRERAVDAALLERNRLELVRAHQQLSHALIARYYPPKTQTEAAA